MNILQVLPKLDYGGVERGTIDIARSLSENKHKCVVISGGGVLVSKLDAIGVKHYTLPVYKKSPITIFKMIQEIADIIKKENIELVHARSRVPAIAAFFASRKTNVKFITTAHGYYSKNIFSYIMGWGKFVIAISNPIAKHMIEDFGVPYNRIRLIHRGVDLDKFKFVNPSEKPRSAFTVGIIARITPLKGHLDFIKAMSLISREIPRLKVLIIGDAPKDKIKYKEELELLVRRLGLGQNVEFMGYQEDIPKILARLDVLVSATVTPEAFGRVIIEAQAAGVPVVATKVGGVVDIIKDNVNGLLSCPNDPRGMADCVLKIAKNKELALLLAVNGRKNVEENFSMQLMLERTVKLYEEALKGLNILIIKISAIGDVMLSIPSIRAIRKKFPNAVIKILVGVNARPLLVGCPYIDDEIIFDADKKGIKEILKTGSILRKNCFDIVVDLQNNKKSHLFSFLSFAPKRFGYDNGKWSFLLNNKIKDVSAKGGSAFGGKKSLGPIEHQFRVLSMLGIKLEDPRLELWPGAVQDEWVEKFLRDNWVDESWNLIGINPGSSSKWATKRWPAVLFAKFCDEIAKSYHTRVVILGSKEDLVLAKDIASKTLSKPIIAAGKTDLRELISLIKRLRVLVTSDSAPLHIGSALNVPCVALFGPTDPARHIAAVDSKMPVTVIRKNLKCSPCYRPTCIRDYKCMKNISVEEVVKAVSGYIHSNQNQAFQVNKA